MTCQTSPRWNGQCSVVPFSFSLLPTSYNCKTISTLLLPTTGFAKGTFPWSWAVCRAQENSLRSVSYVNSSEHRVKKTLSRNQPQVGKPLSATSNYTCAAFPINRLRKTCGACSIRKLKRVMMVLSYTTSAHKFGNFHFTICNESHD